MTATAALVLAIFVQSGPITLTEYRDTLARIESAASRGEVETVRDLARKLRSATVRHEGVELKADATVLGPLAEAPDAGAVKAASVRLRALMAELDAMSGSPRSEAPDPGLLERLRQEEAEAQISPDGKVAGPGLHAPRTFVEFLQDLLKEIGDLLGRFFKWLFRLLFSSGGPGSQGAGVRWMVIALVALVLGALGMVAVMALRRSKGFKPSAATSEAPAISAKDEDPLSRSASEWERFAAELMGAGRFREAIRAWYHAVLVSLFRVGALHYRKDRTNWEYAYALPSSVPWRAGFVEATRTFEQEWYGRRNTAVDTAENYQRRAQAMLAQVRQGAAT